MVSSSTVWYTGVVGTKTCAHCQITKSTDLFYKDKSRSDGFARICKDCQRAVNVKRYHANAEEEKAKAKQWRLDNLERSKEYDRKKYATKKDIYKERNEKYRVDHPERLAFYKKRWNDANRDHYREIKRKNENARRARKNLATSALFPVELLQARIDYYGGKCWICKVAPYEHLDHVKPVSKGGAHILSNIRPACAKCNISKSNKWPFVLAA